jgi:hypothetical protein
MQQPEFSKTYVRADFTALLTCPHCWRQRKISTLSFIEHKHKLKVKCSCKESSNIFLEYRRRPRKKTHLPGTFINHSQNSSICHLYVLDVSLIGLTFSSLENISINKGDELSMEFYLDDNYKTKISRDAIVRSNRPGYIFGAEFEKSSTVFDGPLGHYITHVL